MEPSVVPCLGMEVRQLAQRRGRELGSEPMEGIERGCAGGGEVFEDQDR